MDKFVEEYYEHVRKNANSVVDECFAKEIDDKQDLVNKVVNLKFGDRIEVMNMIKSEILKKNEDSKFYPSLEYLIEVRKIQKKYCLGKEECFNTKACLLYTSPSPRDS